MSQSRRAFIRTGMNAALATLLASPFRDLFAAVDWNKAAFETKSFKEVMSVLGVNDAKNNSAIVIDAAEIAENGAVVPVTITSNVPATESIALIVEKNPNVLGAIFNIPKDTFPEINTRIKMAETCNVYALVKANGVYSIASREIKVTLGGCGG